MLTRLKSDGTTMGLTIGTHAFPTLTLLPSALVMKREKPSPNGMA
jgi:hypothetical protein